MVCGFLCFGHSIDMIAAPIMAQHRPKMSVCEGYLFKKTAHSRTCTTPWLCTMALDGPARPYVAAYIIKSVPIIFAMLAQTPKTI